MATNNDKHEAIGDLGTWLGFVNFILTLRALELSEFSIKLALANKRNIKTIIKLLENIKNDRGKNITSI